MSDNLNPLSNSRSALIESKNWSELARLFYTVPTDWCWGHSTPAWIPKVIQFKITSHLVHNNTMKLKANKLHLLHLPEGEDVTCGYMHVLHCMVDYISMHSPGWTPLDASPDAPLPLDAPLPHCIVGWMQPLFPHCIVDGCIQVQIQDLAKGVPSFCGWK